MRRTALVLATALTLGAGAGFFVHTGMAGDEAEGAPPSRSRRATAPPMSNAASAFEFLINRRADFTHEALDTTSPPEVSDLCGLAARQRALRGGRSRDAPAEETRSRWQDIERRTLGRFTSSSAFSEATGSRHLPRENTRVPSYAESGDLGHESAHSGRCRPRAPSLDRVYAARVGAIPTRCRSAAGVASQCGKPRCV